MIWIVNIVIAVIAVAVLVGWIRNRRREDYRDIRRAEISDDLAAQDELLEDALNEHPLSDDSQRKSGGG
jgi:hypothetical protein